MTMNAGVEGCSVDYANNTLYCGTDAAGAQHSLWAISTLNGTRLWSTNAGAILNRPILHGSRIYARTVAGSLRSHAAADGSLIWSYPLPATPGNFPNPVVVSGGAFDGLLLVTGPDGFLRAIQDMGSSAVPVWSNNYGGSATSAPVAAPGLSRGWVGMSNGRIIQFDLATGVQDASAVAGPGAVRGLDLDFTGPPGSEFNRLTATSTSAVGGNLIRRYCIPWIPGSSGSM